MRSRFYYIVNGLTLYRLFSAPVLVLFVFLRQPEIFKWLLALSFFTDGLDGTLARRYKVSSEYGSRLDSIADDLTITAGLIGMAVFKPLLFHDALIPFLILFLLFILQMILALVRYRRFTSFHTYGAKIAALLQGVFLILLFFLSEPMYILFYVAIVATGLELLEEIILICLLPVWKADVRGLYWALKKNRN
jgi:CDP-diacylglycerol--glycerol-3-phosphate 3-phosphatidyltransferase